MAYLLDSNVFIRAKNDYYGFDFCPAFWEWLEQAHGNGVAFSVEAVYDELVAGGDDLAAWARARKPMFVPVAAADLPSIAAVNRWANDSPDYEPAAKSEFASVADSFLVGQAVAGGHTIVTHEKISDGRRRIKIPNAAIENGVSVTSPFQMLRATSARFVLESANRSSEPRADSEAQAFRS